MGYEEMSSFCRQRRASKQSPWSSHTNKQQPTSVVLTTKRCFSTGFGFIKKFIQNCAVTRKGTVATKGQIGVCCRIAALKGQRGGCVWVKLWRCNIVMMMIMKGFLSDAKRASQILYWRKRRKLCIFFVLFLALTIFLFFSFLSLRLFVNVFLSLLSV